MKEENEKLLSIMADGEQRSFGLIQQLMELEAARLQNDLKVMTDDGLLEQTVVPDDDLYLITSKGLSYIA
jgi:hypothetical protein